MQKPATYQNFDLIISPTATDGQYTVRVIGSPVGEHLPEPFMLPFSNHELRRFFGLRERTRGMRLVVTSSHQVENLDPQNFGTRLYTEVFANGIDTMLQRSLDATQRAGEGLRIRLRLTRPNSPICPGNISICPNKLASSPPPRRQLSCATLSKVARWKHSRWSCLSPF
jgi:hypothetical protein